MELLDREFISLPKTFHTLMLQTQAEQEKEINRLKEEIGRLRAENVNLKRAIGGMHSRLADLQQQAINSTQISKKYGERVKDGVFRPRLNIAINEKSLLEAILKLKSTDINEIARLLGISYATVRRRLIEYKLYPLTLPDAQYRYLFYSVTS